MMSAVVAAGVATALYPLTWIAKVSGTFCKPLYTNTEFWYSLTALDVIFPATLWVLHWEHEPLSDREPRTVAEMPPTQSPHQTT